MDCREAGRALSARADGELAPGGAEALEEHLGRCGACARWAEAIEAIRAHFREMPRPAAPRGLGDRVLERIRRPGARLVSVAPLLRAAAAAAGILLLVSGTATFLVKPGPPVHRARFPDADEVMKRIARDHAPAITAKETNR